MLKNTTAQIVASWQRCTKKYKLNNGKDLKPSRLTDAETRDASELFTETFRPAQSVFDNLVEVGNKSSQRIHISDLNGTLLKECSPLQTNHHTSGELALGSVLMEEQVGTNAAGTCLATGEAITVYRDEHFSNVFHDFCCSSAPLISPFGEVVGALSISSAAESNRDNHNWVLGMACNAANEIEAAIFRSTYSSYYLLSLTTKVGKNSGLSNQLLAVNDSGWVIGATTPALQILGIEERSLIVGQELTTVFGYSLEEIHRNKCLPLQTADQENIGWYITLEKPLPKTTVISESVLTADKPVTPLHKAAGNDNRSVRNAAICSKIIDKKINVLLMGETGTGKEVWAQAIHNSSNRRNKPFVTLNCAAIPESLIESELFGYSSGTFTGGLKKGKVGKIEASDGGTLFLDEIGDMPLPLQARLLRVLAEGEVTPLGQLEPIKVDLNVICATHRNLLSSVESGKFREDLYYRISGVSLTLSALRERSDRMDVINKVLENVSEGENIQVDNIALSLLDKYSWPGNIRQLKNVLQFAVSMCDGKIIRLTDLPNEIFCSNTTHTNSEPEFQQPEVHPLPDRVVSLTKPVTTEDVDSERNRILKALEDNRWVVLRAARELGISRSTLHRKINTYGLNQS